MNIQFVRQLNSKCRRNSGSRHYLLNLHFTSFIRRIDHVCADPPLQVAMRIAQGMGLHRDPEFKRLDMLPFEIEMRRRTWWALIVIGEQISHLSRLHFRYYGQISQDISVCQIGYLAASRLCCCLEYRRCCKLFAD